MICQRTGYCCINLPVVVVAKDDDDKWAYFNKPQGVQCLNLEFDAEGKASCKVHDEPWYFTTPCHTYQNSKVDPDFTLKAGKPCALGPLAATREGGNLVQLGTKPTEHGFIRLEEFAWYATELDDIPCSKCEMEIVGLVDFRADGTLQHLDKELCAENIADVDDDGADLDG